MKKLLHHSPYISTIPEQSHMMGIIGKNEENWNWFLNYFIQLEVNKNTAFSLNLNFSYGDNYNMIKNAPILNTYSLPRDIVAFYGTISTFARKAVNAGYFVYLCVDRYEIEAYKEYQKEHGKHDLMITGYDEDYFEIADFFFSKYSVQRCCPEQLECGYRNYDIMGDSAGFDEVMLLKANEKYVHTLNISLVKTLVEEYLTGSNSNFHFQPIKDAIFLDEESYAFGLNVYPALKEYLKNLKNGEIQIRSFHILYEHKRMMQELLNYLHDKKYLRNGNRNIEIMEAIENYAMILRNLALKYSMTAQESCLDAMLLRIDKIAAYEVELFTSLVSDICDTPLNWVCRNVINKSSSKDIVYNGSWAMQANAVMKSSNAGDSVYYIFQGNKVTFQIVPSDEARYIKTGCDGELKEYCIGPYEENIIIEELTYGYHYIFVENIMPCVLELLAVECQDTDIQEITQLCMFEKIDDVTNGFWQSSYGKEGYDIFGYKSNLPFYVKLVYCNLTDKVWRLIEEHDNGQALMVENGKKIAACKFFKKEATIDMIIAGNDACRVSFYIMECYNFDRKMSITVVDADNFVILNTHSIHVLKGGVYVCYKAKGHLLFKFENHGEAIGVVSAIFIDKES